ncbi:hypothetical protein K7I13_04310 [Brucepastera parasyntrophica]|uniref:hypothetical protein n=1 Tax=Brucepastera parasyntrophica TaxID=2880008 RepID=UPI00210A397B|nr:hypothetical protein [Brucepastera parasyntrophica]ULQ60528.1 hypothetical protein K7I13_04310 [Brucepastera parasyntrophica]
MNRKTTSIDISLTNDMVNGILRACVPEKAETIPAFRYNEGEESFILLKTPLEIPEMPVHHPIEETTPPAGYLNMISGLCSYLAEKCPFLVKDTKWFFNPVTIHQPCFYRLYEYEKETYVYLLRVNLLCRPLESEVISHKTNAKTAHYRTNRLYVEADFLPLSGVQPEKELIIHQTIPDTWKGEAGQGYMIYGIWMDADINKFFSKLVIPAGKRIHPYYPVTCKYRCISLNALGNTGPGLLHEIRHIIEPCLDDILEELQVSAFSEQLPLFRKIKKTVPHEITAHWKNLSVQICLNTQEQKEYVIEF